MFEEKIVGLLMKVEESPEHRYNFEVWFDYTREAITKIKEGTLVAVKNFETDSENEHYSVLEINSMLPSHYAIDGATSGYPGFVTEAAKNASQDWIEQETQSFEDTTKIKAQAIPTGLQILQTDQTTTQGKDNTIRYETDTSIPMLGFEVKLLDKDAADNVVNSGFEDRDKDVTNIGKLLRNKDVDVKLRIDEMLRKHFAIFGFTGVGKSNLISTLIKKLFEDSEEKIKVVFFDLMSEYNFLLSDCLLDEKINGNILSLNEKTFPQGIWDYYKDNSKIEAAIQQLDRYTLLPKKVEQELDIKERNLLHQKTLEKKIIKLFDDSKVSVYDYFFTEKFKWGIGRLSTAKRDKRNEVKRNAVRKACDSDYSTTFINSDILQAFIDEVDNILNSNTSNRDYKDFKNSNDFNLGRIQEDVKRYQTSNNEINEKLPIDSIIRDLNDESKHSLYVVQSHNPVTLREFSKELGEKLYENRRTEGKISPVVTFIFDEADEFIKRDGSGSYAKSAEIAQTIARRGRKFGIGLGISTQRIRYLDTNIMSQPHTYFISKLPRKSDREAVSEAFGMGEDIFKPTYKFSPGNWLLLSHDATGLKAIPIPIKTDDANTRLIEFVKNLKGGS